MLNVISRSIISTHTRGPRKVVLNLLKGLDELGYPYVINADLEATHTLWIHDDPVALGAAVALSPHRAIIAGPNIYTLPRELPQSIGLSQILWLHPAPWVQDFWHTFGGDHLKSAVWPVGIDTEKFIPSEQKKDLVLIYNKQRPHTDVEVVCRALNATQQPFHVITYGKYQEAEYQKLLARSKAIIWIGRSESQGIGLLEALSMNVPALVWEVPTFGSWEGSGHDFFTPEELAYSPVSSAPYFSQECGLRVTHEAELATTLPTFLKNLSHFTPRTYITTTLSLAHQANAFLDLYRNHFSQTDEVLNATTLATTKKWRNASWQFYCTTTLKDAVRRIMR